MLLLYQWKKWDLLYSVRMHVKRVKNLYHFQHGIWIPSHSHMFQQSLFRAQKYEIILSCRGSASGACASSFGVCCVFEKSCGAGSLSENCTYFTSSSRSAGSSCSLTICKVFFLSLPKIYYFYLEFKRCLSIKTWFWSIHPDTTR